MEARILGHLGMETETEMGTLRDGHCVIAKAGDNFDAIPGALDARRADEHGAERSHTELCDWKVGFEGVDLATVAIAPDADVEGAERELVGASVEDLAAQQDQPGA